jgi:glutamyl-tRNA reductase
VSVLVVGLSHKSAPVATLELAAVSGDELAKLVHDLVRAEPVAEAFVVSTCNRVEVYADVDRFHAGVTVICELLGRHCGVAPADLTPHLYVHYEDRAVGHLLSVACGLDSMVVGEGEILGQIRGALKLAEELGTVGRVLRDLGRTALRAGKRVRTETAINQMGASQAGLAVELAARSLSGQASLSGNEVLVVGAGSMSALAATTASRAEAARIVVANRTLRKAERLAGRLNGTAIGITEAELTAAIATADVVISCTGASGHVITAGMIGERAHRPLILVDLAMPRDIDPAAGEVTNVTLIGMDELSEHTAVSQTRDLSAVRSIIDEELAAYRLANDAATVAPTVVALRAKAAKVVDAELARLAGRLSADGLSGHALDEIAQTVRRVVDKLLHAPTVRVKELAGSPGGEEYAAALRVLFDLDPRAVEAVTRAAMEQEDAQ